MPQCIIKGMIYPYKECTMQHLTVNLHPNHEAETSKIMYNGTLMTHSFSDIDITATLRAKILTSKFNRCEKINWRYFTYDRVIKLWFTGFLSRCSLVWKNLVSTNFSLLKAQCQQEKKPGKDSRWENSRPFLWDITFMEQVTFCSLRIPRKKSLYFHNTRGK